jgi:hypothetical protein
LRRFELLLPLRFNDGSGIPGDWIGEAALEAAEQFGAASLETQRIEGRWRHQGVFYQDDSFRLVVDIPDSAKNRRWMKEFKERWRTRLKQIELWMVSYLVEVE